jgi:hypothetical protein
MNASTPSPKNSFLWQYNKLFYKEKRICNRMFGFQKIVALYTQPGPIWWTNYVNPGRTLHHSHASRPPSLETLYDRVTKVQSYNLGSRVNQRPPVHHEDEFLLYLAYLPAYLLAPTEQQTTRLHYMLTCLLTYNYLIAPTYLPTHQISKAAAGR